MRKRLPRFTRPPAIIGYVMLAFSWAYTAIDAWGNWDFFRARLGDILDFLTSGRGLVVLNLIGFGLILYALFREETPPAVTVRPQPHTEGALTEAGEPIVYGLKFANAEHLRAAVAAAVPGVRVGIDQRTNSLIVYGTTAQQEQTKKIVASLDVEKEIPRKEDIPPVARPVGIAKPDPKDAARTTLNSFIRQAQDLRAAIDKKTSPYLSATIVQSIRGWGVGVNRYLEGAYPGRASFFVDELPDSKFTAMSQAYAQYLDKRLADLVALMKELSL